VFRRPLLPTLGALSAVLALASCASPATEQPTTEASSDAHGAVAGAAEMSEPQLHLTTVDAAGLVSQLDLLDESVVEIGDIGPASQVATDGRYLFATGEEGVTVVDSGMWTWDHVDHFHYYRAEPRILGTLSDGGPATVATTNLSTTGGTGLFFAESGSAILLDTAALSKGEIEESFRLDVTPHDGYVVPIGSFALVTDGSGSVAVHDTDGGPIAGSSVACEAPSGTVHTRVGAVLGCADGALLATLVDDTVEIERIAYPAGVGPVTGFANREGRPTAAGLDSEGRILLLDTRERSWATLPAPAELTAVTAVDDAAQHVLALDAQGRMHVIDGATGALLATTAPLVSGAAGAATLIADDQRAYLNSPADRRLYEIDYADGGRIARTFETTGEPTHLAETGR
jgi:DNA-binding beta-propeller fold protein YncE